VRFAVAALLVGLTVGPRLPAGQPAVADVVNATVDGHDLKLDLFLPDQVKNPPLVVFIHGGGWRNNSYKKCLTPWLTDYGFAVASISYRLVDKAVFPAQVHDCKGAIRWLRAHASRYGYDASRIAVAGTSAGGYLALMMGVTAGNAELEGEVGGHLDMSSRVAAIVDYYGPSDFILRSENQPNKTEKPGSPVHGLLGGPAGSMKATARFASPAFHVTADDPPLLIIHGDKDTTVKPDQSERMVQEYRRLGLPVRLQIVPNAGHGGDAHFAKPYREIVAAFLREQLRPGRPR
jgi:acetyl esterase/lipase